MSKSTCSTVVFRFPDTETQVVAHLTHWPQKFPQLQNNWTLFFLFFSPARWALCVSCLQTLPCAAAGHPMARSAAAGENVTVALASARPRIQGSSTGLAVSATTGSVRHIMGNLAMVRKVINALQITQLNGLVNEQASDWLYRCSEFFNWHKV